LIGVTNPLLHAPLLQPGAFYCDPAMTGPGSPYLLDAQERAAMTARVDQFNSVISGIATARNWGLPGHERVSCAVARRNCVGSP
jgi:hypothetical protein